MRVLAALREVAMFVISGVKRTCSIGIKKTAIY
jgi:hypothetical protein